MIEKYHNKLETILAITHPRLRNSYYLEFQNSFGAVAGYINGQIFIVCGKLGIALKLPQKALINFFKLREAKAFKYFKNGHIKKEYALFPKKILDDKIKLKKMIEKSIRFVLANKV